MFPAMGLRRKTSDPTTLDSGGKPEGSGFPLKDHVMEEGSSGRGEMKVEREMAPKSEPEVSRCSGTPANTDRDAGKRRFDHVI